MTALQGDLSITVTGKLWRSANVVSDDPQIALARLDGNADALTTALAWRSLAQNTSEKRFEWIEMVVSAEVASETGRNATLIF